MSHVEGQFNDDVMTILLHPGQRVKIQIADSDTNFIIDYNSTDDNTIHVIADDPDREDEDGTVIYVHDWSEDVLGDETPVAEETPAE